MAWMRVVDMGVESNIAKYFPAEVQKELVSKTQAKTGSILMFIADTPNTTHTVLDRLRRKLRICIRIKLYY